MNGLLNQSQVTKKRMSVMFFFGEKCTDVHIVIIQSLLGN